MSKPIQGSLSAIKSRKKKNKTNRNILSEPGTQFWPVVPEAAISEFNDVLERNLPCLKCDKPKLSWSKMMKLNREERRKAQSEAIESLPEDLLASIRRAEDLRTNIAIGVNASLRCMENGKLVVCLLEEKVDPKFLLENILTVASSKKVPIALLPGLKELTKRTMGLPSIALGFKVSIDNESCPLRECCKLKDLIEKHGLEDAPTRVAVTRLQVPVDFLPKVVEQERMVGEVLLRRTSTDTRVFIPGKLQKKELEGDFIQVGESRESVVGCLQAVTMGGESVEEESDQPERYWQAPSKKKRPRPDPDSVVEIFRPPLVLSTQSNPNKSNKKRRPRVEPF